MKKILFLELSVLVLLTFVNLASAQYILNTTTQQTADFNISGGGTASTFNVTQGYYMNNQRILRTDGAGNLFAGIGAGNSNIGFGNSFFGHYAGYANRGDKNSFFGSYAGNVNRNGDDNSFFGRDAGLYNIDQSGNTFIGSGAGLYNGYTDSNSSNHNTFIGAYSGNSNQSGSRNTALGSNANFGSTNLINATAIGANALVTQSDSLVLGNNVNVGIGTSAPVTRLEVKGTGIVRARVNSNENAGLQLALNNQSKWSVATHNGGWFQLWNYTIGQEALVIDPANSDLHVQGRIHVLTLGSAGGASLCRNTFNQISNCSSSLRYKTNIAPFSFGLSFINQLRPITFDWKQGGSQDVGFGAEDVAKINPLFVTYNDKGEIEGVKYDRLSVAFVNAFKEQQEQIEAQQKKIDEQNELIKRQAEEVERQRKGLDALKKLVCESKPEATICKEEQK